MSRILAAIVATALMLTGCSTSTPGTPTAATTTAETAADQQIAEQARQLVAKSIGQPDGNFAASSSDWAVSIKGFTFKDGTLHVAMQLDPNSADRQRTGTLAAMAITSYIRLAGAPTLKGAVKWVETTAGTASHIAQKQG